MKLYLIKQSKNHNYDTYDSAVVAAPNEDVARQMDPSSGKPMTWGESYSPWCYSPDQVTVLYIGESVESVEEGVICASFNADLCAFFI